MIEQFFTEIEGPDRDWQEDYEIYSDESRLQLIIEPWKTKDPKVNKHPSERDWKSLEIGKL